MRITPVLAVHLILSVADGTNTGYNYVIGKFGIAVYKQFSA